MRVYRANIALSPCPSFLCFACVITVAFIPERMKSCFRTCMCMMSTMLCQNVYTHVYHVTSTSATRVQGWSFHVESNFSFYQTVEPVLLFQSPLLKCTLCLDPSFSYSLSIVTHFSLCVSTHFLSSHTLSHHSD